MARAAASQITYTVFGTGEFPFDMLRTDRSTPRQEIDSAEIERSTHPRNRRTHHVTLVGPNEPNVARWQSFGWNVENVRA
jgi:hypothetical protein